MSTIGQFQSVAVASGSDYASGSAASESRSHE